MFLRAAILDDLLKQVFGEVLQRGTVETGNRGRNLEVLGAALQLDNPRARLSRTETKGRPFSALAELLWYLSGSDRLEFIERYIPSYAKEAEADGRIHGAYGPRLCNMRGQNQITNVTNLLRERPGSKRAVIQLYSADDITRNYKEIPCTTAIQFLVRDKRLVCIVTMRSNDAFKGLPHDIFCFTMLQEIIARDLGVDVGAYKHFASSLHLYEDDINKAETYLTEGVQSSLAMPAMPDGPQWPHPASMQKAEHLIRDGHIEQALELGLPSYWQDLVRLLAAFGAGNDETVLDDLADGMTVDIYRTYLQRRKVVGGRRKKV